MATGEDRQESALDLANDCGWVRALDANGKSIRISKADMVELIRANMPVVTSTKEGLASNNTSLMYSGNSIDCNTANQGIYTLSSLTTHAPAGIPSGAAVLISLDCYFGRAYVFQLCFELLGDKLYSRHKTDENWSRWISISFT